MTAQTLRNPLASHRDGVRQIASFVAIGVVSTAAYVALYAGLRSVSPAGVANALALVVTAVANTAANRRLTFEVRGRDGLARDHAAGLIAFGAALAITSASLAILQQAEPQHGRMAEVAVLVAANAAATLVRFLLLRVAIDRSRDGRVSTEPGLATLSQSKRTRG
jgi:putative flippase GtrA